MKFRRRQRWLRRFALAFAFATAVVAGKVAPSWATVDGGGTSGQKVVVAPSGDEIAIRNAIADRKIAAAGELKVIPYLSHGILGESVKSRTTAQAFVPGVTDFPKAESAATRPDDRATRFTPANPPVISYLSHGMAADGELHARPDNRADRFTPADGVSQPQVEVAGSSRDWNGILTFGLGAVVLGLALGLAFGYLRRPRLAL